MSEINKDISRVSAKQCKHAHKKMAEGQPGKKRR